MPNHKFLYFRSGPVLGAILNFVFYFFKKKILVHSYSIRRERERRERASEQEREASDGASERASRKL